MLIKWLVDAILATIDSLLTLMPGVSLSGLSIEPVFDSVSSAGRVFPLAVLFTGFVVYYGLKVGLMAWDVAVWAWHQIHGAA